MKILIIHDRFMFRGGAERLILTLAKGLGADLATGFWNEAETYPKSEVPHKLFILGEGNQKSGWRYLKFQLLFYFRAKFIRDYDLVIFSGNNCLSAAHYVRPGVKKIFYCHTPVRHAYDLKNYYLKNKIWWKKLALLFFIPLSRLVYNWGFKKMDIVIANSNNVQARLKKYLKRDSFVVYPPIATHKFVWRGQGDYYLSFGRVDKLKRIPDLIGAFGQLPDKKLIIASGGDDFDHVQKLAAPYKNIIVLGWVDDSKLQELIGHSLATLYIPINEDFGMTPLESMAAGKPVVGVAEGGLLETIIDGTTGKLIPAHYTIEDIINAIKWLSSERALAMRSACEACAQEFSEEKFIKEMKKITSNNA